MINPKMLGMLVAAFVAGSFLASPELRAYANTIANDVICNGCVGTSDLANNAVTAAKVKDGEIKAAEIATNAVGASEIATDAVGAAELQGVTKLLFAKCVITSTEATRNVDPGSRFEKQCNITGVTTGDQAVATYNNGIDCLAVGGVDTGTDKLFVTFQNTCSVATNPGNGFISIIVYRK